MNISSVPLRSDAVLAEYRSRTVSLNAQIADLQTSRHWALVVGLTCAVLWVVLLIASVTGARLLFAVQTIPLAGAIYGLQTILRKRSMAIDLAHRSSFFERGIDRLEDNWRGKGRTGVEFERDHHLYQSDLDILGRGIAL